MNLEFRISYFESGMSFLGFQNKPNIFFVDKFIMHGKTISENTTYCNDDQGHNIDVIFDLFLGYCLYLEIKGSYVNSYSCRHFIQGCHNTSYLSTRIFESKWCNYRMLHSILKIYSVSKGGWVSVSRLSSIVLYVEITNDLSSSIMFYF